MENSCPAARRVGWHIGAHLRQNCLWPYLQRTFLNHSPWGQGDAKHDAFLRPDICCVQKAKSTCKMIIVMVMMMIVVMTVRMAMVLLSLLLWQKPSWPAETICQRVEEETHQG